MIHLSLSPGKATKSMTSVQTSALKNASVLVSTRPVVEKPKSGGTLPVAPTSSARTTPSCSPQPTPEPQIVVQSVKRKRQASPPPQAKKQRATTRPSKRDKHDDVSTSRAPRSKRGTPVTSIGGAFGSLECTIPRPISIEEDGRVNAVSSEEVVLQVMNKYKAFFRNPDDAEDTSFQPHPSDYPRVQFNYPNAGATETFALLFPIDKDDYQPIRELMNTIQTIVQYYLTPEQQIPFGHSSILVPDDTPVRASHSPAPTSGVSTPVHAAATPPTNLLRTLTKAYNTRNGPLFIRTVNTISGLLEELRPAMHINLRNKELWPGVPPKVWSTVVEECYHRSVGPRVEDLTKYVPFSDNVYGELNASFISDIVHRTGLAPGKNFVDLGCGVGNCLIQASLQSGCTSKGIELLTAPANLAHAQHAQFLARLHKWGLSSGEVIVRTGDFCEHPDVKNWMATADLVLVNNWAFSAQLNERLSLLFLDLPDHAKIISLKPFVPSDFKLNQRTIDSPLAILRVEEHSFRRGAVSWTGEGGVYYLHTIDRRRICEFLENSVAVARPTRSRR